MVHIKRKNALREISHFFGAVDFTMGEIFVRNSPLDKQAGQRMPERRWGFPKKLGQSEKNEKKT